MHKPLSKLVVFIFMKLKIIINEEISKLFEGVADTYGEKFGLSNPAKDMDRKATAGIVNLPKDPNEQPKADPKGEFVGQITQTYDDKTSNVYANPKSLEEFDANVRAVSSINGDLFVIQYNLGVYHSKIIHTVVNSFNDGKTDFEVYDDAYYLKQNITWHRIEKTNDFGYSVSTRDNLSGRPEFHPYIKQNLDAVRAKNPNLNFIPIYWEKLRKDSYNIQDIMQNNPYGFKKSSDKYGDKDTALELMKTEPDYAPIRQYVGGFLKAKDIYDLYKQVLEKSYGIRDAQEFEAFQILRDNIGKGITSINPYNQS